MEIIQDVIKYEEISSDELMTYYIGKDPSCRFYIFAQSEKEEKDINWTLYLLDERTNRLREYEKKYPDINKLGIRELFAPISNKNQKSKSRDGHEFTIKGGKPTILLGPIDVPAESTMLLSEVFMKTDIDPITSSWILEDILKLFLFFEHAYRDSAFYPCDQEQIAFDSDSFLINPSHRRLIYYNDLDYYSPRDYRPRDKVEIYTPQTEIQKIAAFILDFLDDSVIELHPEYLELLEDWEDNGRSSFDYAYTEFHAFAKSRGYLGEKPFTYHYVDDPTWHSIPEEE